MRSFSIHYKSRDDLTRAKKRLSPTEPRRLLIQVFCGEPNEQYIQDLIARIDEIFPDVPLIGTTTAGEIMDGESFDRTTVISFTLFAKTVVRAALVGQNDDLHQAGRQLGAQIGRADTKLAIVFGCGIKNGGAINGEPLLAGFQEVCPKVMVAGAQAGDNGLARQTFVFTQDGCTEKGVAAASLSGQDLIVNNRYNLSWVPLGKRMEITKAEGTCIRTIDGKPAKEIYSHYLGDKIGARLPNSAAEFPLMVERHGLQLARHANKVLPDGSLDFMAPFHTGEKVRFAFCHTGLISDSTRRMYQALEPKNIDAIFIYSCLTRKWVLGQDCKLELAPLACLGPTAGFFSYGEYYSSNGENMFLSQTMTVLTLSEDSLGDPAKPETTREAPEFRTLETKQVQDLQALHRLVETSANEREVLIKELKAALSEIKTLRGFVPICASCKKIRDDKGYWNRIEQYIEKHTEAQFSHGICPTCAQKLYPRYYKGQTGKKSSDPA